MNGGLLVYGAGSTARLVIKAVGRQDLRLLSDSAQPDETVCGYKVEPVSMLTKYPPREYEVIVAIGYQHGGMNARRQEVFSMLKERRYVVPSVASKNLVAGFWGISIGDGTIVMGGTEAHHNTVIGENVFIGSNVTLGHDVIVESHAWINSGVTIDGGAVVGERCVIGSNAVIGAGVKLGERTLVGPGAVVLRDTEPDSVWLTQEATPHRFSSNVFGRMG